MGWRRAVAVALAGPVVAFASGCGATHVAGKSTDVAPPTTAQPSSAPSTSAPLASAPPTTGTSATAPGATDSSYPPVLYPTPAPASSSARPWTLIGACADVTAVDHFDGEDKTHFDINAYLPAILGAASPYARADRALWSAIAAAGPAPAPLEPADVDLANYDVGWTKGSPDMEDIDWHCRDASPVVVSTFVTVGLSAAPAERGYAYFVWRGGRPLLWAVRHLAVVGPWAAPPAEPGRVVDTTKFTARPRELLSAQQVAAALGGRTRGDWSVAATPEVLLMAQGSGGDHETDGHGTLAAVDRRTGSLRWRASTLACDSVVTAGAGHVWVSPACSTKGGYARPQTVEEYDAASGRRLHAYDATGLQGLTVAGESAWIVVAPTDSERPHLAQLQGGVRRDVITLDHSVFGVDQALVVADGRIDVVTLDADDHFTFVSVDEATGAVRTRRALPRSFAGWVPGVSESFADMVSDSGPGGGQSVDPRTGVLGQSVARSMYCLAANATRLWCRYTGPKRGDPSYLVAVTASGDVLGGGRVSDYISSPRMDGDSLVFCDDDHVVALTE